MQCIVTQREQETLIHSDRPQLPSCHSVFRTHIVLLCVQADPHPGNLIRTPDGRLAILDFGLVTEIDDNIKFGMVEAISHLIHRDYEAIVEDFVTLQFIDPGTNLRPILPVLAKVSIFPAPYSQETASTFALIHQHILAFDSELSMVLSSAWFTEVSQYIVVACTVAPGYNHRFGHREMCGYIELWLYGV